MCWAAADNDGCRFGHHCCQQTSPNSIKHKVNKNILISTLIYWFYQKPSNSSLGTIMRKAACHSDGVDSLNPRRWKGKQLHHHGGGVCWFFVLLWMDSWRHELIVCKKWYKNNLKMRLTALLFDPPRRAPHLLRRILRNLICLGVCRGRRLRCWPQRIQCPVLESLYQKLIELDPSLIPACIFPYKHTISYGISFWKYKFVFSTCCWGSSSFHIRMPSWCVVRLATHMDLSLVLAIQGFCMMVCCILHQRLANSANWDI